MSWYVVHTKPRMELQAATLLEERLNLNTYFPEVILHRHGKAHRGAFFPCYLFVDSNLQSTPVSAIDFMPGVIRVVRFQDEPYAIPDEIVQQLRLRIDKTNALGDLPGNQYCQGDPVRITAGPLEGLEGIFDGAATASERVWVLLRFLGSECPVSLDVDALEPYHSPTPRVTEGRPRRSRGVYRPISKNALTETTHPGIGRTGGRSTGLP